MPNTEIIMIPEQNAKLGDTIIHEDKQYILDKFYSQGKDAKEGQYKYFMNTSKGIFGLSEAA